MEYSRLHKTTIETHADLKGQTKTTAIERILKEHLDKEGIPAKVDDNDTKTE